ncbi:Copia protein [Symbiodinium microadriaticum]|uniref:Copia protein n=1 Tax=Symbiodinium microadriaticum TaxID=2951 RepID=A0A1Q9DE19_SYMMI|nr:Copia protein [Symbiodinium microadriaticum]
MALAQSVLLILINDAANAVFEPDARSSGLDRDASGREVAGRVEDKNPVLLGRPKVAAAGDGKASEASAKKEQHAGMDATHLPSLFESLGPDRFWWLVQLLFLLHRRRPYVLPSHHCQLDCVSLVGPFGWKLYYFLLFFTSWVQELFWLMLDIQGQHACLAPSLLQAVQVNSHEEEHGEDEQYTFRDLSSARNEAAVHPFRRIRAAYLQRVSTWADALRRVLDNGVALPVLPQHAQVPSPGGWLPSNRPSDGRLRQLLSLAGVPLRLRRCPAPEVLWTKWVGLVENPQWYSGLYRNASRFAIQAFLNKTQKAKCPKPCGDVLGSGPAKYPVPKRGKEKNHPSVFCFSVARLGSEMDTMLMQRQSGSGIFSCDGYAVFSDADYDLDGIRTSKISSTVAGVSVDKTAANSQVFMRTWLTLLDGNQWWKYDFIAKVLPNGDRVWGDYHEIRHRTMAFNPKAWHGPEEWRGVKNVMTKIVADNDQVTPEEALSQAVHVFNARDHVRGFSPIQHAFGRSPDTTGRLLEHHNKVPDELVVESATEEFERSARLRAEAEKAHAQWHMEQRITRALNSRSKPVYDFRPGELVYFWRTQESGQGRRQPGSKHGKFLGPARVLATETRREADGTLRPGSAVWCVRGRSLLKCCPEQLRHASEREELLESLARDHGEEETPWTFTKVAEEIGGNQYQDISEVKPDVQEWVRSQDLQEETPPVRYRFRGKRAEPEPEPADETMIEHEERSQPSQPSRPRVQQTASFTDKSEKWTDRVPQEAWTGEPVEFWRDTKSAVEVEITMPETRRTWEKATNNLQAFFAGALKRRAVEVSEKKLSPQELQQFKEAKAVEVKNFLAAEAFQALPPHLRPNASQAIGMRWILTWKSKEDGTRRAKARAVLLGYQDPAYEHRATTAPVMTRQSRQLILQIATNRRWTVQKGDVSGAFLQGRQYPSDLYCIPCDEICQAMQLPPGTVTKLKRACYGLVDAPLEWYRTVHEFLLELGLQRIWSDACVWTWRKDGILRGVISGHVDDFLFGGSSTDREWQAIIQQIQQRFKWGDWDSGKFTQCGVQVEQTEDGFLLSQKTYLEDTPEIPLNSARRKNLKAPTTDWEKSKLRGVLGAISWHAQQVSPHLSAEVSLLLSEVNSSSVETVVRTNQFLSHAKAKKDHQLRIHRFPEGTELGAYTWVDAGSQNRPDGGSTQGVLIGLAPTSLLQGEVCPVSVMAWHSNKIERVCRSPGAAETQAAISGEDLMYYLRYQWGELLYGVADAKDPDSTVRKVPGCVISDSRNVFDKLQTEVVTIKGAERKANIELLSLKEAQLRTQVEVRWVHSEAQLANSLTKAGGGKEIELFYRMNGRWRIVEDELMRSARRRKTEGLVDPDAILFADRMRGHLAANTGQDVFFLNCNKYIPETMYGALEVFSKQALGVYKSEHGRCEKALPFAAWGEDRYMANCLEMLGVRTQADETNFLHDERCWGVDCGNHKAVAFHSFKHVNTWLPGPCAVDEEKFPDIPGTKANLEEEPT